MIIDEFLEHHGVKGMRWGVRRRRDSSGRVSGPSNPQAKDLSDEDLKKAVSRMQMERQYNQLIGNKKSGGHKAVKAGAAFVAGIGMNIARQQIQNTATKKVEQAFSARAAAPRVGHTKSIAALQKLSRQKP